MHALPWDALKTRQPISNFEETLMQHSLNFILSLFNPFDSQGKMALSLTGSYPASMGIFTAGFKQPDIPTVATELRGAFVQHKWNSEVSHITNGYWYNSAANGKVRVDEAYDGAYASSLFDFTDMNSDGNVKNHLRITSPSIGSDPTCFDDYVEIAGFPVITADFLQAQNATFGGIVHEPFLGEVQTWDFLYADIISVVAYLNNDDPPMLVGYDFWGTEKRTKTVTRFFAQQIGEIAEEVFDFTPCRHRIDEQNGVRSP